jgi:amino acid transporter
VGLLVPYTDKRLIGHGSTNAKASPFVIAITNAGIVGLDSVMNVVIMVAVLSVGNSAMFGSSRTLAALAEQGQAPKILAYIDRKGRPIVSIGIAFSLGFIAYISVTPNEVEAFTWMLAVSGLSSIFTWGSICLAHIRFRRAWKVQGRSLDELVFRSQPGVIGSWIGFGFNVLILIADFWTGFAPIGYKNMTISELVISFFSSYLAAPIVILFYVSYKFYYKTPIMRAKNIDLKTGMRELNSGSIMTERDDPATWPKWKVIYKAFC